MEDLFIWFQENEGKTVIIFTKRGFRYTGKILRAIDNKFILIFETHQKCNKLINVDSIENFDIIEESSK